MAADLDCMSRHMNCVLVSFEFDFDPVVSQSVFSGTAQSALATPNRDAISSRERRSCFRDPKP